MSVPSIGRQKLGTIIGSSPATRDMLTDIYDASPYNVNVLTVGPTGSGKELVAQTLHAASGRKGKLVSVNCAAIPRDLLEAELFGHEKGAFTGAAARRIGRFEEANKGTLFLDEIGDMPLELQGKLLRVLEARMISRVGSNTETSIDFRLVCATHQHLHERVKQGLFREDLLFRLSVLVIKVPPLKDRLQDIPELLDSISRQLETGDSGLVPPVISKDGLEALMSYEWPGNIRELKNFCQRAAVLCRGKPIGRAEVYKLLSFTIDNTLEQSGLRKSIKALSHSVAPPEYEKIDSNFISDAIQKQNDFSLKAHLDNHEREFIETALKLTDSNVAIAARKLGLHRTTLLAKMRKYGISNKN
jgi:sigma-54 specific flagellar transcriptional regulator A